LTKVTFTEWKVLNYRNKKLSLSFRNILIKFPLLINYIVFTLIQIGELIISYF
jgi:hypothetical protein